MLARTGAAWKGVAGYSSVSGHGTGRAKWLINQQHSVAMLELDHLSFLALVLHACLHKASTCHCPPTCKLSDITTRGLIQADYLAFAWPCLSQACNVVRTLYSIASCDTASTATRRLGSADSKATPKQAGSTTLAGKSTAHNRSL